ncbi:MAG TPA: HAMP domain-containing sensor histidine kinase, partial [Candidatus Acidoferrales bacterium]|nr:HAMP domain-containing sensor histidine kinase [Candidatus Acidoferrales bacterium]
LRRMRAKRKILGGAGAPPRPLGKKNTVLLLRTVVVISTGYLILFGNAAHDPWALAYIAVLFLSNLGLGIVPEGLFHNATFSAALLLGDTAAVLFGLYITVGCFSQDFLIIYFFTIFMTTATEGVAQIAVGAAIVSSLYGYWLYVSSGHNLGPGEWLRLPFFFIVAVFYAYMTEETKAERWRRQQVERERERLKYLFSVTEPIPGQVSGPEWITEVARSVEAALPRLNCRVAPELVEETVGAAVWFPIRCRELTIGGLLAWPRDAEPLSAAEEQFCKVVASVAGHVLTQTREASDSESLRLRQEFLGMLSHELRTPLHAILGYAEMLEGLLDPIRDPRVPQVIERLRANACHLQGLVGEMLWLAELRAGENRVEIGEVELRKLLTDVTVEAATALAGRPIELSTEVVSGTPPLLTDGRKLQQIVGCLVSNASKFTSEGFIRVRAAAIGDEQIEIAVSDSGVGIEPEHMAMIFEEFRQVDASLTRRAGGLGLGLALARELAHLLHGEIAVDSVPRRGSTFRLRLPVRPPATCPASVEEATLRMRGQAQPSVWPARNVG